MKKPKQGFIKLKNNKWSFHPGRSTSNKQTPIELPNFETLVDSLIENKKLFKGWIQTDRVLTAWRLHAISIIIAYQIATKKVSAVDLHNT